MSNQVSEASATARLERDALLKECRQLLLEVGSRPNALKLLLGVRTQLLMFSQYKSRRSQSNSNQST